MYRLVLILSTMFISNELKSFVIKIFVCAIALICNASIKPYKSSILNFVSLVILSCQSIIAVTSFFISGINLMLPQTIVEFSSSSLLWVAFIQYIFSMIVPISLSSLAYLSRLLRNIKNSYKRKFQTLVREENK